MIRILFVCHANICRSPMAEAIMVQLVNQAGLADMISVDSAGTHCERIGAPAYSRAAEVLAEHGIEAHSRARQLQYDDLNMFDYVFAMDRRNLTFMLRHSAGCKAEIKMLLHEAQVFGLVNQSEVFDPYPNGDFHAAYQTILAGCTVLLRQLQEKLQL